MFPKYFIIFQRFIFGQAVSRLSTIHCTAEKYPACGQRSGYFQDKHLALPYTLA
jgi:hypothetical protein